MQRKRSAESLGEGLHCRELQLIGGSGGVQLLESTWAVSGWLVVT